ncbi:thioredoxin fold domain-containing protein [Niallia nealsonii]|uniref:Thioredoxin-like fold domain-containing protein n=1 Tax=Niallia nealsonii TaxID=115979 RepID=A0A2N0Z5M7_9BACI|nr:thioredoxin fold domain-containing protein [Niallia nealsonii]PKG24811.1 hypothetical protein CWS01_04425 [Niallia nealsonii]
MKKPIIMISILLAIIFICFLGIWLLTSQKTNSIDDIEKIEAKNIFSQKGEEEYIVYFWQSTCSYCKQIEEEVLSFDKTGNIPIFIVDMRESTNAKSWYDWEGHHKKYDKVIGKVENGKEVLNKGMNIKEYTNHKEIAWGIETTEANQIIAKHNTAYGNEAPASVEEIEITGTPTMIKIKDGKVTKYAVGVNETLSLMTGK